MLVDMLNVITQLLLPSQTDLRLDRVVADDHTQTLMVDVTSTQEAPACPRCAAATPRIHSRYTRTLADLPWADVAVQVQVQVRKCVCPTETCVRTLFCERVPQLAQPWARRTQRPATKQERIGVALGGAAGERLADDLDQSASRDTLIQLVRRHELPTPPTTTDRLQPPKPVAASPATESVAPTGSDGQKERRRARYAFVCQLHAAGWRISAIVGRVGLYCDTVRQRWRRSSYAGAGEGPS